jgi:hypothetical protein
MLAVGFFLFNLIFQFALNGQIKILSIKELWTSFDKQSFEDAKVFIEPALPAGSWSLIAESPAAIVILIIAGIFYLPTKILMFVTAEKKQ